MANVIMCPCGIAKVDCDYHKPVDLNRPGRAGQLLRLIDGIVQWTDIDRHVQQVDVEFIPVTDGSVIYHRYDPNSQSWKVISPDTATIYDHPEYLFTPA